jgi:hypothetical protein
MKEKQVGKERDQRKERGGDERGEDADGHGKPGDGQDAKRGREITQVIEIGN